MPRDRLRDRGPALAGRLLPARRIVLCYHQLREADRRTSASPARQSSARSLPVDRLRCQLDWLGTFAEFIGLDLLSDNRASEEEDGRWKVSLTFDDGFRDNLELGLPLLEHYRVPMTWFVATDYVEDPNLLPWWTMLDEVGARIDGPFSFQAGEAIYSYDLSTQTEKQRFVRELSTAFRSATPQWQYQLERAVRQAAEAETELPNNRFARREEVQEAARSPWITIGGHTMSHPNLAHCNKDELEREVAGGRQKLQEWTGQSVDWFAYPFGRREHWNETVIRAVQSAGFEGAVTTIPGYVGSQADRYRVPRLVVQAGWDMDTFKTRVLHATLYRHGQRLKRSLRRLGA